MKGKEGKREKGWNYGPEGERRKGKRGRGGRRGRNGMRRLVYN